MIHAAVMVLCLPIAALGALMPVNKYVTPDNGLANAIDCDGPMAVFMLAGPALIFYVSNAVSFFWNRKSAMRWHIGMAVFCLIVSAIVLPNAVRAFIATEQNKSESACA
jgi:hypothetical protein